ncbi:MAG: peptidylprolyl isomerase [Crocinitomicaceae bacterium]|nr:peptidylprolyl isomerase [Crocinitomicaceae bacterium]
MMNRLSVFAITILLGFSVYGQEDPTIMTINDNDITKSEFLQIYLKNNNDPKYDQASLDEYMELFKKFKLKVAEAEAMGYDTIPKLVKELEGYRKQLALPYLVDSAQNDALVLEAYNRTAYEVRASHIMLKIPKNASPEDTLVLYNRMLEMKKRLDEGQDFAMVAQGKGGSEDPSVVQNQGDLGFFTAFQMVYPFEENAYTTEVGQVSNPFRTRFGYHILKVTDKRPARGTIETAHIMVQVDRAAPDGVAAAEAKIKEIYDLLEAGGDFEDLVLKYSDDPSSNKKKGLLPPFGTGTSTRMVPGFEEAAFALENDGDYSQPIRTTYGFHIVKRLNLIAVPTFEELKEMLEKKVAKDERSKTTQDSFVLKLKDEYGYKNKTKKSLQWFYDNIDSTYNKGLFDPSLLSTNKVLFMLGKQKFTQQQFAQFLKMNYRGVNADDTYAMINEQYKKWEKQTILDYEESKLAGKYPAFKALVTEYHDGILLYEIMSDLVWNKAMKDTTGLQDYYAAHKTDYMWGTRLDADVFECYSEEAAKKAYEMLQVDSVEVVDVVKTINGDSELKIRHRNGKFDIKKTSYLTDRELQIGLNEPFEIDGKIYVIRVKEKLAPAQKEFSEAKGAITSDYQNHLEREWLKELEVKHKIVIDSDALYSIGE